MAVFVIGDTHLSCGVDKPMDVFGGAWENYTDKLFSRWRACVAPADTVVIAGDVSWGMSLADALPDFQALDHLPGRKILLKGNHDYWWDTVSKMTRCLRENGLDSIGFLYNNCVTADGLALCGTRGWTLGQSEQDEKMLAREAGRLDRSLAAAPMDAEKIAFLHYPPFAEGETVLPLIEVLQKHNVKRCFYGHLHGASLRTAVTGEHYGINFYLVSADALDFCPYKL